MKMETQSLKNQLLDLMRVEIQLKGREKEKELLMKMETQSANKQLSNLMRMEIQLVTKQRSNSMRTETLFPQLKYAKNAQLN